MSLSISHFTGDKSMKKQKRKMILPVLITVFFLAYLIVYGYIMIEVSDWNPVFFLFAIPLVALGIGMIHVLISRIREIRSGEEDDLDNY